MLWKLLSPLNIFYILKEVSSFGKIGDKNEQKRKHDIFELSELYCDSYDKHDEFKNKIENYEHTIVAL